MKRAASILLLLTALASLNPPSQAAAVNVNEGQWQITMEVEMPGMPMKMPPMTHTQCITANTLVPQDPQQPQSNCKLEKHSVQGNTVIWTMVCQQPDGTLTSNGRVTYNGDSFEGETKTLMPSQGMEMTSRMRGKRVGPCK